MVSFDVESHFTNVPIKECLDVVKDKLTDNEMPFNYVYLLKVSLDGNYFLIQGQYYFQVERSQRADQWRLYWLILGWSILKRRHLAFAHRPLPSLTKLRKRYVDDVF